MFLAHVDLIFHSHGIKKVFTRIIFYFSLVRVRIYCVWVCVRMCGGGRICHVWAGLWMLGCVYNKIALTVLGIFVINAVIFARGIIIKRLS